MAVFADMELNQNYEVSNYRCRDGIQQRKFKIKEPKSRKLDFLMQKLKSKLIQEKCLLFVCGVVVNAVNNLRRFSCLKILQININQQKCDQRFLLQLTR